MEGILFFMLCAVTWIGIRFGLSLRKATPAADSTKTASATATATASATESASTPGPAVFKRKDVVFGEIEVDGTPYTTFDQGEVRIYNKANKPVLAFRIDGKGHMQRSINYVRLADDVRSEDGTFYHVKHSPDQMYIFQSWLETQINDPAGTHKKEAAKFKDLMEEIAAFNALLQEGKIRSHAGGYVVV